MTPPPLPPSARSKPAVSRPLLWTVIARVVMFAVFISSIGLVCWSLYQFYVTFPPLTRQLRQKDSERASLASQVQQLEMDWNAAAAEKLEADYEDAQAQLFADSDEQNQWSNDVRLRAKQLAFDADVRLGAVERHPDKLPQLALVPVTLDLQPTRLGGGLTNSPYERLLALAATLESQKRRADFLELSVTSDSNSVSRTRARFQLWGQAKEKSNP